MPRKVFLHIGAPKTGTTYLQDRLAINRKELAAHGVHYPLPGLRLASHFHAALDLLELPWGFEDTSGHWDKMVRTVNRLDGTAIISHEVLASATTDQVRRAMASFGDAEVHVVYSQRDLGRQIPAAWQETIKNRKTWSYSRFLKLVRTKPRRNAGWWFWKTQSLVDVLERWSEGLPPERVHVVVVPQGGPRDELWHRYCRAFGIDPAWAPGEAANANPSIGAAQTTMIRRLNKRLHRTDLERSEKRELVKEVLVQRNLAARAKDKVTLRPRAYGWVTEIAEEWLEWLDGAGVDVIGDPAELLPVRPGADVKWVNPDKVKARDIAEASLDALAVMTLEAARRTDPDTDLSAKVGHAVRRLRGQ